MSSMWVQGPKRLIRLIHKAITTQTGKAVEEAGTASSSLTSCSTAPAPRDGPGRKCRAPWQAPASSDHHRRGSQQLCTPPASDRFGMFTASLHCKEAQRSSKRALSEEHITSVIDMSCQGLQRNKMAHSMQRAWFPTQRLPAGNPRVTW